jgi:general secretion pathway protein N
MSIISAALRTRERGRGARFARTGFAESTLAELAWQHVRGAAGRWAVAGAVCGALAGLVAFAPAAWLASAVASATAERLLLACCLRGEVRALIRPGFGRVSVQVLPAESTTIGQWPAAWLAGLGTPWNTLQLGGALRLTSPGLTVDWVQGRPRFSGEAALDVANASSRLATLDSLGSYRLTLRGNAAGTDAATLTLITVDGALRLSGQGEWTGIGLRFRGEAQAAEGSEAALNNLLNIIGRRQGERSVISIG